MKKLIVMFFTVLLATQVAFAGDYITRNAEELPLKARNFINQHFTAPEISYVKIESELLKGKKYEAVLTNGIEIEFDSSGEWTDVDCKRSSVPMTIVPDYARQYVEQHFAGNIITQIERERYGIKIELNNDLDLKFDKKGNMFKIDD